MLLKDCEDNLNESKRNSLYDRPFRYLLPRPTSAISINNKVPCCCVIPSSYFNHTSNNIGIPMNHHHQGCVMQEQASKDIENHVEPLVSSRWNPTPEQLMALEEMYRHGVRTPSAEEIKLIAAKLRQFGKIEAKNVFYWFQNHKARERQKRRRQPDLMSKKHVNDIENLEKEETGFSGKALEAEQNKKLVPTPTCCSTSKQSVSVQRSMAKESGTDGWTHLDEREFHQMSQKKIAKGATTSLIDNLSCVASNSKLLNSITTPSTQGTSAKQHQKLLNTLNFRIFSPSCNEDEINYEDEARDYQTLQLFPLRKDDHHAVRATETEFKEFMTTINSNLPPYQFYEFL
ncbi:hypothetical protein ACH5RR_036336 [Cinchona calisaya]|uniref:Homeobox domain-containing protein n=1 Tax=Cinchona calisaya TaxID=153742 RepID=A0ABD2Y7P0_9GENT